MAKKKVYVSDFPELLAEWDYEKNRIDPASVTIGSHKKVWWKCIEGHSWNSMIKSKANGRGCPYCSGRFAIKGVNDLETLFPMIAKEWNYKKNNGHYPNEYKAFSNQKVWWICSKGHEWQATIVSRTDRNTNCPICANQKVLKGYNDLESQFPKLVLEWNYDKNEGITPNQIIAHTGKKYWWKCKKGHEWQASVNSRIRGNGCPLCSKELKTSFPEQAVYYYVKMCFSDSINRYRDDDISELDIFIPSKMIGIEYDGLFFHKDIQRDIKKTKIVETMGIILYRIKEDINREYTEQNYCIIDKTIYYNPNIKGSLNPVIQCILQLLKTSVAISVDVERDRTKIWEQYIESSKKESLQELYPSVAIEWNNEKNGTLKPDMVTFRSAKVVWWKCSQCGNEWEAAISHRTNGTGCPICASKKISEKVSKLKKGENDLLTKCPDIAEEWDYDRNGELSPSEVYYRSGKTVWWKCKRCGFEYTAPIHQKTKLRTKCNNCLYATKTNNLKSNHPKLLLEWDYNKNIGINPSLVSCGSAKRVWWKCYKCGYEWQSRVAHRTNGTGCPKCSKIIIGEKTGKAVIQYSLNGDYIKTYKSAAEAERITGAKSIHECCNYKLKTSGGFIWRYADEDEKKTK